jgi:hypothetical protein
LLWYRKSRPRRARRDLRTSKNWFTIPSAARSPAFFLRAFAIRRLNTHSFAFAII